MIDFEVWFRIPFTLYWVARMLNKPRLFFLVTKNFDSNSGEYYWREV